MTGKKPEIKMIENYRNGDNDKFEFMADTFFCAGVGTTSLKHPPDIFRDLTENRSIFRSTPENGPFSGFFSDTKIWTFLEMLFPKNSTKKKSNSSEFTLIYVIILIIFSLFTFYVFRIVQKFVSKFPFISFCLLAEGTP
jgi:hypothetical protein